MHRTLAVESLVIIIMLNQIDRFEKNAGFEATKSEFGMLMLYPGRMCYTIWCYTNTQIPSLIVQ
jgi:hypothetical protein